MNGGMERMWGRNERDEREGGRNGRDGREVR